jgi:hypothetical protein
MNEKRERYFIVEGGEIGNRIESFFDLLKKQREARMVLCKKYGTTRYYANSQKIFSFAFDTQKIPDGWVYDNKSGGYKPNARTKSGREEIKSWKLPIGDCTDFTYAITGEESPFFFMDGLCCRFMSTEKIGDTRILIVPFIPKPKKGECGENGWKWNPPDDKCREIKTSEYYSLKESIEENKNA